MYYNVFKVNVLYNEEENLTKPRTYPIATKLSPSPSHFSTSSYNYSQTGPENARLLLAVVDIACCFDWLRTLFIFEKI